MSTTAEIGNDDGDDYGNVNGRSSSNGNVNGRSSSNDYANGIGASKRHWQSQ